MRRDYPIADNINYCFVGIRRCGKSYLMYQRYQELLARGVSPAQMLYVSFEDERLSGITVQELNRLLEIKQEMTGGAPILISPTPEATATLRMIVAEVTKEPAFERASVNCL